MKNTNQHSLAMSHKKRVYLKALARLEKGELTCSDAADSLGISERHLYRLRARSSDRE